MSEPVGSAPRGAIPGNSHREREEAEAQAEPREKIEKIVEGKVVTRKAPWWKRATRSIVAEDAQSIGDFLWSDILIPTIKNAIRDVVVGGTDRALYGNGRISRGSGLGLRGSVTSLRTRYDQMSEEPRRMMSREARATHDFGEIVLDSRPEAVEVIEELISLADRYGAVSVSDLYDLLGVSGSFADRKWGWRDLRSADVRQSRGGFLLDLPRPEPLR